MLRFTAEIVPFGMESCKRTIGDIVVANIGGDSIIGEYEYTINYAKPHEKSEEQKGTISGFNRSRGALALLYEILNKELKGE